MSKENDIIFLEEMLERFKKAPQDSTQYEYVKQMIIDWLNELYIEE
jgi:hypothetical protein